MRQTRDQAADREFGRYIQKAKTWMTKAEWDAMTPEEQAVRRASLSEREKARWASYSNEERAEIQEKRRASYRQHFPLAQAAWEELQRQIAAGEVTAQPCDRCGGIAHPFWDKEARSELRGWRCYPCRKAGWV